MKINISPEYYMQDEEKARFSSPAKATEFLVRTCYAMKYGKDGVKGSVERRAVAKVQNALGKAVASGANEIELEGPHAQALLDALKEWAVPPTLAHWLEDFLTHFEPVVEAAAKK